MNGGGCFLKSFSLRTVKLSSRWLEIIVGYRWLKMVVFEIIFIMFASFSQTRQPLIAASIYLLSVTWCLILTHQHGLVCYRWLEMIVCYRYLEIVVCYRWLENVICYRYLEMVVCYKWLKMVVFEIIFIMFASCSQTRQPLIAASVYLLSVTWCLILTHQHGLVCYRWL